MNWFKRLLSGGSEHEAASPAARRMMEHGTLPTADSIVNVWLVVDRTTAASLQGKSRTDVIMAAGRMIMLLDHGIFPAIADWMKSNNCTYSILGGEAFDDESLFHGVREASSRMGTRTIQSVENCRAFLIRKGQSETGGSVAVVVGMR